MLETITHLLNQTVGVCRLLETVNGDTTYEAVTEHPCRIEYTYKRLLTAQGTETTSTATVFIADIVVGIGDKLILPDGTEKTAIQVNNLYGGGGEYNHSEVYI